MVSFSGAKRSGKTLTMAMLAQKESKRRGIMSSIPSLKVPHHRLKWEDFFTYVRDEKTSTSKTEKKKPKINWPFWIKNIKKGIYIDEIHNLASHTSYVSQESKCLHNWVSQVGKVQMDSGDWETLNTLRSANKTIFSRFVWTALIKEANFYFNSQRAGFIDKYFRDLSDLHINISKDVIPVKGRKLFFVHADFYFSDANNSGIENYYANDLPKRATFCANPYFGLYGTHQITTDGSEYL